MQNKTLLFIFIDGKLLVNQSLQDAEIGLVDLTQLPALPPELAEYEHDKRTLISSSEYGEHWLVDIHHETVDEEQFRLVSLRELLAHLQEKDFQYVAQAWQFALFMRTHRFCGRCGSTKRHVNWEMAMHCDKCQHRVYPRVSPCIIVAIHDGSRILLAQGSRHRTSGYYSTLAGFVESAESLEQAIHREVHEEVGVTLSSVEYFGSQAWPFPHSLMVGYIAKYQSGDIKIDEKEICDAQWFDIDALPLVPPKLSIAGKLIEETVNRLKKKHTN